MDSNKIVLCNEMLCSIAEDYHDIGSCNDADPKYCQYYLNYADNLATRGVLIKDSMGLMLNKQFVDVELVLG